MHLGIVGDESIDRQACTYAEYRLFAALSQVADTSRVSSASLIVRRVASSRHCDGVLCSLVVEFDEGKTVRRRASGSHPYAAINRAVDGLRRQLGAGRPQERRSRETQDRHDRARRRSRTTWTNPHPHGTDTSRIHRDARLERHPGAGPAAVGGR